MGRSESRLNVGVIGAGYWATSAHIPGILQHKRAHLRAVQNRSMKKASQIAKDFGADLAFDNYRDLVLHGKVDAVIVSSTPNVHFEQAAFALKHDKHVLIEKPMTFTVAQAQELCDLASSRNLHLVVSCPWHYTPHGIKARKMIADGVLGNIKMISILMTNPVEKLIKGINTIPTHGLNDVYIDPAPGSYSDPAIAGGGQIFAQVSHVGAYLSFLTGCEPTEVYAKFDFADSQNDIYDVFTITLNNNILVSMASTGATPESIRNFEIRVYGTEGVLLMELWRGQMSIYPFTGEPTVYPELSKNEIYPDRGPVSNFIDVCLGVADNGSPGKYGIAAMKIIEAATLSNKTGTVIKL